MVRLGMATEASPAEMGEARRRRVVRHLMPRASAVIDQLPTSSGALEGPSLFAVPFLKVGGSEPVELLSDAQRRQLARHASVRVFPARHLVYRAGAPADSVFVIGEGVVKSFRDLPSGRRRITAFLFARDLFGLAEAGLYVNTVQTIT